MADSVLTQGPTDTNRLLRGWLLLLAACVGLTFLINGPPTTPLSAADEDEDADYPEVFHDVSRYLKRYYLDLDRLDARLLLEKAFAHLENSADDIYVENSDPSSGVVTIHVGSKAESFRYDGVKSLGQAVEVLESVFVFLKSNYKGETKLNNIRYATVNGFLSGLDPHTIVFSPEDFKDFSVHIEGEICGVGMYVGTRDGKLTVIEVLKGTPAQKAGFKKSDLIMKIGDESTINMTVNEAVDKIRGKCGSTVTLTVKRPSAQDPENLETLSIPVDRARVVIKSVESKLIKDWNTGSTGPWKGSVGYVWVRNFDKNTTPTLRENLDRLVKENDNKPLAGLVLDLRNNSGGLLTQAVDMCDLFLETGEIVITASRDNRLAVQSAAKDGLEPEYPIAVLANEQSASGAEIVIGALQKNDRAVVLGTRTFGKGSVQQLHQLANDAQLKITVSEYLIPGKISIQENGVVPDILAQPEIDDVDFDLFPNELSAGERNYDKHIVSRYAKKETPRYTFNYLYLPPEKDNSEDRFMSGELEPEKDKLVEMALNVLKLADRPFKPSRLLEEKKGDLLKQREGYFGEVVEQLKKKSIDWSPDPSGAPSVVPEGSLDLQLSSEVKQEPSREKDDPVPVNMLILTAKLTNKGTKPIHRMKGLSRAEYFVYKDREFLFGKVDPGQTVERTAKVRLPYFPYSRNDLIQVDVSTTGDLPSGDSVPSDPVVASRSIAVEVQDIGRPAFSYAATLLDASTGKTISDLTDGVRASLKVKVRNTGSAPAYKGIAILRNETGRQVFLEKGRIEFTNLAPQASTEVEFTFEVRSGEPVEAYKLEFVAADSYSNAAITRKLSIPRAATQDEVPFPNGVEFAPPAIVATVVDPQTQKPVLITDKDQLRLDALVKPSDTENYKAWVYASVLGDRENNVPDKILLQSAGGKEDLKIGASVPLKKGINVFTVVSNAKNGLESRQSIVVRRE